MLKLYKSNYFIKEIYMSLTFTKKDDIYKEIKQNLDRIVILREFFHFDIKAIAKAFMIFKGIKDDDFDRVYNYMTVIEKKAKKENYRYDIEITEEFLFAGKNAYFQYKEELRRIAINHFKLNNPFTEEMFRDKSLKAQWTQKLGIISKRRGLIELDTNPYLVKEIKAFGNDEFLTKLERMEVIKDKMIKAISTYFLTAQERKEIEIKELKTKLNDELKGDETKAKRLKI
jgi:hypothetical protein